MTKRPLTPWRQEVQILLGFQKQTKFHQNLKAHQNGKYSLREEVMKLAQMSLSFF